MSEEVVAISGQTLSPFLFLPLPHFFCRRGSGKERGEGNCHYCLACLASPQFTTLSLSPPPLSFPYDSCRQFQGPVNSPPLIFPYLFFLLSRSAQRPGHLLAAVPVDAGRGHVQGEVARLRDVSDASRFFFKKNRVCLI